MSKVVVYTDGACSGNPGPGGWGVLLRWKKKEKEMFGGEEDTTNNRMELMAAIMALETVKPGNPVQLHTDSKYVMDGVLDWMPRWKKNGWRTANKKPVKNVDLWQRLDEAANQHDIEWCWVKGHAGHEGNERADALANLGMAEVRQG